MRKTVYKWFWAWEFEKEERWLEEMVQSGWVLDGVGFCKYKFIYIVSQKNIFFIRQILIINTKCSC